MSVVDARALSGAIDGYPEQRSAREAWPELQRVTQAAPTLAVAATYTVAPLFPHLGAELALRGFPHRLVALPFNTVHQELLEPSGELAQAARGLVLARLPDLIGEATPIERATCVQAIETLCRALGSFAGQCNVPLWVGSLPQPWPPRLCDRDAEGAFAGWLCANQRLLECCAELDNLRFVELNSALAGAGPKAYDDKMWFLARQPFSDAALAMVARATARSIAASLRPAKKVLALDCDGVLWHGVVGEDGIAGLRLGDDPLGRAHLALQRECLRLRERGVLLALCSKNSEADVWRVFDSRPEMLLSRAHLSAHAINWRPKSENLAALAAELNVSTDSLVVLDDNPAEVAEVRANLPECQALLLPKDIAEAASFLAAQECFDVDRVTDEDRQRADRVRVESQRKVAAQRLSPEEFLKDLRLRVAVGSYSDESAARIVQLLQKTNQFNLTTRRHTREALKDLLSQPGWACHTLTVADRYGDYGLTALAIAGPSARAGQLGGDALVVDTFLLSCRVLGRDVERALMVLLIEQATALDLTAIEAEFIPTAKNQAASGYLPNLGFQQVSDTKYRLALADGVPTWPTHIETGPSISKGNR